MAACTFSDYFVALVANRMMNPQ